MLSITGIKKAGAKSLRLLKPIMGNSSSRQRQCLFSVVLFVIILRGTQAQRLHLGIPCSKLLLIEDAGHFIWIEQPEVFFTGISKFLPELGYEAQ